MNKYDHQKKVDPKGREEGGNAWKSKKERLVQGFAMVDVEIKMTHLRQFL